MSTAMVGARAFVRDPADWLDDLHQHRRTFGQSRLRWHPQDAVGIALHYAQGCVQLETPRHLKVLADGQQALRDHLTVLNDAMIPRLRHNRGYFPGARWERALSLMGLTNHDVVMIIGVGPSTPDPDNHRTVRRALRDIPWPNPFTQVWELRQMYLLYAAADDLLEDAIADLALELEDRYDSAYLAALTDDRTVRQLHWRINEQRQGRGEPADPRRRVGQRYNPID